LILNLKMVPGGGFKPPTHGLIDLRDISLRVKY